MREVCSTRCSASFAAASAAKLETAANTLGIGYGYGFRLNLGIFVLRYTQAYTVDDVGPGEGESRSYWSIGADF